jgi:methylglyoxal synthase
MGGSQSRAAEPARPGGHRNHGPAACRRARPAGDLLQSGPLGGDQQIGALIASGDLDVLVFFTDPMHPQAHDSDVKALMRIAVVWNIPIACNRASADLLITSPLLADYRFRREPSMART